MKWHHCQATPEIKSIQDRKEIEHRKKTFSEARGSLEHRATADPFHVFRNGCQYAVSLVRVALTKGLGYASALLLEITRTPVNHPLDGATGAFYVKGPVTGYGGIGSSLKVLKAMEGRCVRLCWAHSQPEGPEGLIRAHHRRSPVPSRRKPR